MKMLRIIGGQHRGRRIRFESSHGLRPSLDHVREMVFNWLQWDIDGRGVLDLFAGSGAFGIEALSRGASFASFVESHRASYERLRDNIALLNLADQSQIYPCAFTPHLKLQQNSFDLVFLDPPYDSPLLPQACQWLDANHILNDGALIYIEAPARADLAFLPSAWKKIKFKKGKRSLHGLWQA